MLVHLTCIFYFVSIFHNISSVFTARRYTYKRGLCCGPVFVRLSVCHVRAFYPDG